ncbi:MAG: TonB-dependent receptor plug domain-containing protein [Bacteroidia bacterium]|nr:TonB-dependent receptor plug domain-containing protein [Bacteroidia bacterium]
MKQLYILLICLVTVASCGPGKVATNPDAETETLEQKNRAVIPLITRIRQLPGIVIRGGVPVFNKTQTDVSGSFVVQPLYVLDGYAVGNSFTDINQLVQSIDVKKIEAITGPETAIYGSRGGGGVIKITTYK